MKKRILCAVTALLLTLSVSGAACYADAVAEGFWATAQYVDEDYYVNAPDGGVNLREGPGADYTIVFGMNGLIPNGTKLHIENKAKADNGKYWGETIYNDKYGWVFLGQLSKEPPAAKNNESSGQAAETPASQQSGNTDGNGNGNGNSADQVNTETPSKQEPANTQAPQSPDSKDTPAGTVTPAGAENDPAADPEPVSNHSLDPDRQVSSGAHSTILAFLLGGLLVAVIVLTAVIVLFRRKNHKDE